MLIMKSFPSRDFNANFPIVNASHIILLLIPFVLLLSFFFVIIVPLSNNDEPNHMVIGAHIDSYEESVRQGIQFFSCLLCYRGIRYRLRDGDRHLERKACGAFVVYSGVQATLDQARPRYTDR